jgi:NAD(P)-dependent dehydrogenase (short-subunit alcohol dehydrogenase family)
MKPAGQVAIITGTGRNIGEDAAKLFAAECAKGVVVDMDRDRGERVVSEESAFIVGEMLFVDGGVSAMLIGDRKGEVAK